jgi:hypothetical protein
LSYRDFEVNSEITDKVRKRLREKAKKLYSKFEKLIDELKILGEESISIGNLEIIRVKNLYFVYNHGGFKCCIYLPKKIGERKWLA